MKNTTKLLFIISLCCILFASQCRKDTSPPAPPPEKYNYFVANVNGKEWITGGNFMSSGVSCYYYEASQYLQIEGFDLHQNSPFYLSSVFIELYNITDGFKDTVFFNQKSRAKFNFDDRYSMDSIPNGYIFISNFDVSKRKLSGTFEFKGYGKNNKDSVWIKNGILENIQIVKS